eukprot:411984_1
MQKNQEFLERSKYGSIPPKVVLLFCVIFVVYLGGSTILFVIVEKWNLLDAIYFSVITISTVGYGDIVPITTGGKFINVIFTLTSFSGIFLLFRVVVGYVVDHQISVIIDRVKLKKKQESRSRRFLSMKTKSTGIDTLANEAKEDMEHEEAEELHHGKNVRWLIHLTTYCLWLIIWILFYSLDKGEDLSFFNALYFGVITSTTIGYG